MPDDREAMERALDAFLPERDAPWPDESPYGVFEAGWLAAIEFSKSSREAAEAERDGAMAIIRRLMVTSAATRTAAEHEAARAEALDFIERHAALSPREDA